MDTIPVYVHEDPYLTNVINQLVTRSGQYYSMSKARTDIGAGRVSVDGVVCRKPQQIFTPGVHTITIDGNTYSVRIVHSAKE